MKCARRQPLRYLRRDRQQTDTERKREPGESKSRRWSGMMGGSWSAYIWTSTVREKRLLQHVVIYFQSWRLRADVDRVCMWGFCFSQIHMLTGSHLFHVEDFHQGTIMFSLGGPLRAFADYHFKKTMHTLLVFVGHHTHNSLSSTAKCTFFRISTPEPARRHGFPTCTLAARGNGGPLQNNPTICIIPHSEKFKLPSHIARKVFPSLLLLSGV